MLRVAHPWRQLRYTPLKLKAISKRNYTPTIPKPEIVRYHETVDLAYTAALPQNGNATDGALVIIHGLFGSKRNWFSLSKAFHCATSRPVYTLDLRNHGASPRAVPMTYEAMAADVTFFIERKGLTDVALLGHSMGGKTAMALALSPGAKHIKELIVVDIAPVREGLLPEFVGYIEAMQHVNEISGRMKSKTDVDLVLQKYEPDLAIRQFLLTNLHVPSHARSATPIKQPDKLHFALPLSTLKDAIPNLGDFPWDWRTADKEGPQWPGKTLVVRGTQSPYIPDRNIPALKAFFPNMRLEDLDTRHWVQAEKPNEFKQIVVDFLRE